jgi:hypothetical protein
VRDIARRNPSSEIQEEEDTAGTRRRRRKPGTACASRERERESPSAVMGVGTVGRGEELAGHRREGEREVWGHGGEECRVLWAGVRRVDG